MTASNQAKNITEGAVLQVNDLKIFFDTREGSFVAVDDSNFVLKRGSILGIVGESGSGKSVSCYSLLGLIPCPPGRVESGTALLGENQSQSAVDLLNASETTLRSIRGSRIAMIFQDPMTSLNPNMTVGRQLIEALQAHRKVDDHEAKQRAIAAMEEVGIRLAAKRFDSYPFEFSGGMRQRVMIAMALITEPELLIADEPTTALDVTVQKQILDLLKEIQAKRELSILFITHDLAVIARFADDLIVMEKGVIVERGDPKNIFHAPTHEYTKKLIAAIPTSAKPEAFRYQEERSGEANSHVQIRGLRTRFLTESKPFWHFGSEPKKTYFEALKGIDLDIYRGEILGLVGESGSGKSTLGRSIIRLIDAYEGEAIIDGVNLYSLDQEQLRKARPAFQMIFQDPYASLNPRMTVFDTLAEPMLANKLVARKDLSEAVNQLMDEVGLARRAVRKYPHEFSGGQRQRIAVGRALASKPQFIVADEPVSALDVTIQAQILDLILNLVKEHKLSMMFISHDLSVVRYLCDRVAVMQQGQILEVGLTESVYNNAQSDYTRELLSAVPSMS